MKSSTKLAGVAATAALAAIALNYNSAQPSELFLWANKQESKKFQEYISEYGKNYATAEELAFRQAVFFQNMEKIAAHNSQNGATHTVGVNFLTDMTDAERKNMLGYKGKKMLLGAATPAKLATDNIPSSINWVTKGAVTNVKN